MEGLLLEIFFKSGECRGERSPRFGRDFAPENRGEENLGELCANRGDLGVWIVSLGGGLFGKDPSKVGVKRGEVGTPIYLGVIAFGCLGDFGNPNNRGDRFGGSPFRRGDFGPRSRGDIFGGRPRGDIFW